MYAVYNSVMLVYLHACVLVYSITPLPSSLISYDELDKFKLTDTQTACNMCESSPELMVKALQDSLHLDFYHDNSESPSSQSTPGSTSLLFYSAGFNFENV